MTEDEWKSCTDPQEMQDFLRDSGKASERKLRLFACACCRSIWDILYDERSRDAVAVSERYADGRATTDELESAFAEALHAYESNLLRASEAAWLAAHPLTRGLADSTSSAAALEAKRRKKRRNEHASEEGHQAELLRDLFGPLPFREVCIDPEWLNWNDGTVRKMAQAIYDEQVLPEGTLHQTRLGILADALEESGCVNVEILVHCRQRETVHVRGCWAVDLLTGRH